MGHRDPDELNLERYNLGRAILVALSDYDGRCPELEAQKELACGMPEEARHRGGLLVPDSQPVEGVRTLASDTATAGAEFVFERPGPLAEALRARSILSELGASFITGFRGGKLGIRRVATGVEVF